MVKKSRRKWVERERAALAAPRERIRYALTAQIAGVYFLTALTMIFFTVRENLILLEGPLLDIPTYPLTLLMTFYYAVPVILALVTGLIFRPFWRHFRNLLATIILIQLGYSCWAFAYRQHYLQAMRDNIRTARAASLKAHAPEVAYSDVDGDRRFDEARVSFEFDLSDFPDGIYSVFCELTSLGDPVENGVIGYRDFVLRRARPDAPDGKIKEGAAAADGGVRLIRKLDGYYYVEYALGGVIFRRQAGRDEGTGQVMLERVRAEIATRPARQRVSFAVALKDFEPYLRAGVGGLEVNVGVRGFFHTDDAGREVLQWTRFAPFFRRTTWDGRDAAFARQTVLLDYVRRVLWIGETVDGER